MKTALKSFLTLTSAFCLLLTTALAGTPTQITVEGMTCSSCVKSVTKAFKKHPEVKSVKVDVKTGQVTLTFNTEKSLTEEQIRETVKGAGYKVTAIKTDTT